MFTTVWATLSHWWTTTKDFVLGPKVDPGKLPLLHIGSIKWTQEVAEGGCFILAAPRWGKTTLLATISYSMLRAGHGGVVLAAKVGVAESFLALARKAGREKDVVILKDAGGASYNPLSDLEDPADVAALIVELDKAADGGGKLGVEEAAYWVKQRSILMTHLCVLVKACDGVITFSRLAQIFGSTPTSVAQTHDPSWRASSEFWKAVERVREHDGDVANAVDYFVNNFAARNAKLTDSARSMVDGIMEPMKASRMRALIDGVPTLRMRDVFDGRKILVMGVATENTHHGKLINAIVMHSFLTMSAKRPPGNRTFIIMDECQKLATPEVLDAMAFVREARVTMVLATQSLAVLRTRLDRNAAEGVAGLAALKIIGRQDDAESRKWVSDSIGMHKVKNPTPTYSDGKKSITVRTERELRVTPEMVGDLGQGHSLCIFEGGFSRAKWPLAPPLNGRGVKLARWLKP